jgi:hypothetical protein
MTAQAEARRYGLREFEAESGSVVPCDGAGQPTEIPNEYWLCWAHRLEGLKAALEAQGLLDRLSDLAKTHEAKEALAILRAASPEARAERIRQRYQAAPAAIWREVEDQLRAKLILPLLQLQIPSGAVGPLPEGQGEGAGAETAKPPKLTNTAKAVLAIIKARPKGKGISGKEIIKELQKQGIELEESTLRRSIIPELKLHGVENHRARGGYLLPH